jgi:hypothetical protein
MRKKRMRVNMWMQMRTRAGGKKWEIEVMVDDKGYEWIRTRRTKKCSSPMVVLINDEGNRQRVLEEWDNDKNIEAKNNDNDEDDAEKFAEETMNANVNMN